MKMKRLGEHIVGWLGDRIGEPGPSGFVVGISGGIDSAVTATLCASTGAPTICVSLPILQVEEQYARSLELADWLEAKFANVSSSVVDLSEAFVALRDLLPDEATSELALANTRSRLRMAVLYAFANTNGSFVCGTGNRVEDFGIGFFTKYGDGGVDLSPIGDLMKSTVFELGAHLGVPASIQNATPTDGLWPVDRPDEDQIGATYAELEWAMEYDQANRGIHVAEQEATHSLSQRQLEVWKIYHSRHEGNLHKMAMPPICEVPFGV